MCVCVWLAGRGLELVTKTDRFAPSVKCHWFSGGCHLRSARLCDKPDTSAPELELAWCHSHSLSLFCLSLPLSLILSLLSCQPRRMTAATMAVFWPHGTGKKRMSTIKKWMRQDQRRNVNCWFSGGHQSGWWEMSWTLCFEVELTCCDKPALEWILARHGFHLQKFYLLSLKQLMSKWLQLELLSRSAVFVLVFHFTDITTMKLVPSHKETGNG